MIELDVCISTYGPQGICRLTADRYPPCPGVRYVVSWQNCGEPLPPGIARPDMEVYTLEGRGLSRNRNNAVAHARAPLVLTADDDVTYTPARLWSVIDAFAARPGMQWAVFRYDGACAGKYFPDREFDLSQRVPGFEPSSIQMAFTLDAARQLPYDERFGLGSGCYHCGEDSLVAHRAVRMGLPGRYIPLDVATHRGEPTGLRRIDDVRVLRGMGAVIAIKWPWTAPLRVPLKAWRMWRSGQAPFLTALRHLTAGAFRR